MKNFWEKKDSNLIYQRGIVSFKEEICYHNKKKISHPFFKMEFLDWVNIVPITPENEIVFVKQYRFGIDDVTLEVPAGTLDSGENDPEAAAKRELLEETGYASQQVIYLGKVAVNPAIQNNYCHFYLAEDASLVGEQNLDLTEDIEVELIKLADVDKLISNGSINHSLAVLALLHTKEYLKNRND
ncbi:8-oxo-dGTP pyrophosphatase MutT (NUDIX family) [Orenia metallireducens]|jgi:8-oxo-dGTP pyrophosphatase MutT (NUDIX family)|uniref:8-oxo-dGTP pyrophosphatase MutT, NUDIX family n=1 Tax=Orenia metallireducens TaxID=1413210 RepID=A0A285GMY8_9FIRM|nr:NUDIX hydrolase [Orenia metallireducens]PRX29797.1 8-oxo-dGTP pyrophosphatase MutT (NUDIX family) [Orenia metallireducens]SNY24932.1 8-oxo-dGTP pyrophosphatase MutT, NUDIX family [Orenia metallireducens]